MMWWRRKKSQPPRCSVHGCKEKTIGGCGSDNVWLFYCKNHLIQVDYAAYLLSEHYAARLVGLLDRGLGIRRGS